MNQRGITFSLRDTFTNITIPGVAENNGTTIYCGTNVHGINEFGLETPIVLKILGKLALLIKKISLLWDVYRSTTTS